MTEDAPSSRKAQTVDKDIGRRVRLQRRQLGLSQGDLASKVGLSFQQVQKYESGATRIGVSRLHEIAAALGVSPSSFFDDRLPGVTNGAGADPANVPEASELLAAFSAIQQGDIRRQVLDLVGSIAMLSRALR